MSKKNTPRQQSKRRTVIPELHGFCRASDNRTSGGPVLSVEVVLVEVLHEVVLPFATRVVLTHDVKVNNAIVTILD